MQIYIAHPAFTEGQAEFKERFIARLKEQIGKLKDCGPITLVDPFHYAPNVVRGPPIHEPKKGVKLGDTFG